MLHALGRRLREARIRRGLRQEDVAEKLGFSRATINAVERGNMTTGMGVYLSVLWIYGLEREIDVLADPGLDREGLALSFDVNDKRVRVDKNHAV
ncbi:MAG: helix-turn-helix transcriptional regulator [Burkholderiales bacterium]|nr:helix-turn-helix transcriptional regulator [Burkholderiales bacterium]